MILFNRPFGYIQTRIVDDELNLNWNYGVGWAKVVKEKEKRKLIAFKVFGSYTRNLFETTQQFYWYLLSGGNRNELKYHESKRDMDVNREHLLPRMLA